MSGIYIPGMEMPKENEVICIFPNGIVQKRVIKWSTLYEVLERSNAVPVPPHGRLIDADALREVVKKHATPSDAWVFSIIRTAPTVIPAEEGE